jgi:hypothetical protein
MLVDKLLFLNFNFIGSSVIYLSLSEIPDLPEAIGLIDSMEKE